MDCADFNPSIQINNAQIIIEVDDFSKQTEVRLPSGTIKQVVSSTEIFTEYGEYEICRYTLNSCGIQEICCRRECVALELVCTPNDINYSVDSNNLMSIYYAGEIQIASRLWTFGDGKISTSNNDSIFHQYPRSGGEYEFCVEFTDQCGSCDICKVIDLPNANKKAVDKDGDGFTENSDCDDNNPQINPQAVEIPCNGIDEDCNPLNNCDDSDAILFEIGTNCGAIGQTIKVPVIVTNLVSISRMTGTISLSNVMGRIVRISSENLGDLVTHKLLNQPTTEAEVTVEASSGTITLEDGASIFEIEIEIEDTGLSESDLQLNSNSKEFAVVDSLGNMLAINSIDGLLCLTTVVNLSGNVRTIGSENLEDVTLSLTGDNTVSATTNENGNYIIEGIVGQDYILSAVKEDNHLNGVTPQDILLMKRHINGITGGSIIDPYTRIAADVNDDQTMSVIDIIETRRIILGDISSFTNNLAWRFVIGEQNLGTLDPSSVTVPDFFETKLFAPLTTASINENFVGIKIGDLNGTVNTSNLRDPNVDIRSNYESISIQDQNFNPGDTIHVRFESKNFEDKSGFLLELSYGPDIDYISFGSSVLSEIDENTIGKAFQIDRKLIALWTSSDGMGRSLEDGENLFTLKFIALQNGILSDQLKLTEMYRRNEVFNSDLASEPVTLDFISLTTNTEDGLDINDQVFVSPNPFRENAHIMIKSLVPSIWHLNVYNIHGKRLYSEKTSYSKSETKFTLSSESLGEAKGVLIYELFNGTNIFRGTLIRVR